MKSLFLILILAFAPIASAADKPAAAASATVTGSVIEVKDVEAYTYLRLKTSDGETWAAISKTPVKKGARVTIENVMVMNNFESRALKQTFKSIAFGNLAGASKTGHALPPSHAASAQPANAPDVRVAKAAGANAWTVAEIITRAPELKDKTVVVRGRIVKYNPGIMGKNWLHLRDGSGSAAENSNDILVTTASEAKLGDIVTVKGMVRTDKDFGSGYAYKTLIEEAAIQK